MIHKKEKKWSTETDPYMTLILQSADTITLNVLKNLVGEKGQMNVNREGFQHNKTETKRLNRKARRENYNFWNKHFSELNGKLAKQKVLQIWREKRNNVKTTTAFPRICVTISNGSTASVTGAPDGDSPIGWDGRNIWGNKGSALSRLWRRTSTHRSKKLSRFQGG